MPTPTPPLFNVKAVANLAGISPHALRAWERRYQVVTPIRDSSGRRFYSPNDIEKLKLLAVLTENGHLISKLCHLNTSELQKLTNEKARNLVNDTSIDPHLLEDIQSLMAGLPRLNPEKLDRDLIKMRLNLPLFQMIFRVFSPFMQRISQLVNEGKMEIAQEHLLSSTLRNHLGELLGLIQRTFTWNENDSNKLPRLLITTPEGDQHEFGVLLAALIAGNLGFKFIYLGPHMPASDLAQTASKFKADIIVLGTSLMGTVSISKFIEDLHAQLSQIKAPTSSIWVGGPIHPEFRRLERKKQMEHFLTLESFRDRLVKLMNQQKAR